MQRLIVWFLMGAIVLIVIGCSTGEVTEQDQVTKVKALHTAEKESQAKDGIKSE
jgi:hypothetical protein